MSAVRLLALSLVASTHALVVPAVPAVASAAVAVGALLRARRIHDEEKAFFSMDWKDLPDEDSGEACIILGEETVPNGKTWYVCTEKSDDPRMDCSPIEGWGNPSGMDDNEWLCKERKPLERR